MLQPEFVFADFSPARAITGRPMSADRGIISNPLSRIPNNTRSSLSLREVTCTPSRIRAYFSRLVTNQGLRGNRGGDLPQGVGIIGAASDRPGSAPSASRAACGQARLHGRKRAPARLSGPKSSLL
jgi:hypothetical protein